MMSPQHILFVHFISFKKGIAALSSLWSKTYQQFICYDHRIQKLVDSPSDGGLLAVFANISPDHARAVAKRIEQLAVSAAFVVPSHDPADPRFDAKRYWRGPAWLIVNYMISDGLIRASGKQVADKIIASSLDLIKKSGFAEYYHPHTGESLRRRKIHLNRRNSVGVFVAVVGDLLTISFLVNDYFRLPAPIFCTNFNDR